MKDIVLSDDAKSVVKEALSISRSLGHEKISPETLLAAAITPGVGFSAEQLKTLPLSGNRIVSALKGNTDNPNPDTPGITANTIRTDSDTDTYITNLIEAPKVHDIIGFDDKLRQMTETLSRKDRANIIIVGETGVGKTSLIEALVDKVREGAVPTSLRQLCPIELDLISLSQGITYKGEIEDRFRKICDDIAKMPQPLLIIEGFHRVMDKQSVLNGILPMLKRHLSKGRIQMVLTTSVDGFTKDIERDKELTAYCEKVSVDEPSEEQAMKILNSKIPQYVDFHKIDLQKDIENDIVRFAKRYMPEKFLPSSAIDLLDRAMASIKIESELSGEPGILDKDCLKDVVAAMTGLPIGNIQSEEREKLSNAEDILHRRVVGQNHAVKSILDAIYESRSGLNKKGQPIGSFFFLGPTGTGKTELAKSLAEFLFND
ncbi:MAG: AAA family ATPase, partial [Muribaculaceae bacterium]|nr:AAA family ATPase [Muribaculaceae bacterium]